MYFDSLSAFLSMGGHGAFVWSAYGIAGVVLASLVIAPIRKRRRFWREQAMRVKREQAANSVAQHCS